MRKNRSIVHKLYEQHPYFFFPSEIGAPGGSSPDWNANPFACNWLCVLALKAAKKQTNERTDGRTDGQPVLNKGVQARMVLVAIVFALWN